MRLKPAIRVVSSKKTDIRIAKVSEIVRKANSFMRSRFHRLALVRNTSKRHYNLGESSLNMRENFRVV